MHPRIWRTSMAWILSTQLIVAGGAAHLAQAADPQPALVLSACHGMASAAPFEPTSNASTTAEREREFVRTITDHMYGEGYERSVQQLTDAIKRNPTNSIFYITRGQAHYGHHEFARAVEDFNHAIMLDPDSWIAYSGRGEAYERMFEHDRAIDDLDRAIQLSPRNARALTFRGSAYLNKREYDRAIADFSRANKLDPRCSAVLVARGTAYELQGDRNSAIADHDAALELNARWLNPRGFTLRASAYGKTGQYDLAIRDLSQARGRDAKNVSFWNNLCLYQAIAGAFEKALANCNEALRRQPDDPHVLDSRGFTYLKMGSLDEAVADYEAALRKEPKLANSLYGRGVVKRLKGDLAASEADIATARALKSGVAEEMTQLGVK
jgi:tetratricopeptide (TPR) repeat protein